MLLLLPCPAALMGGSNFNFKKTGLVTCEKATKQRSARARILTARPITAHGPKLSLGPGSFQPVALPVALQFKKLLKSYLFPN